MVVLRLFCGGLGVINVLVGYMYLSQSINNEFDVLKNLFVPSVMDVCTQNNCFRALAPFYGVTFITIGFFALSAAAIFRERELTISIIILSLANLGQTIVRVWASQDFASEMYLPGAPETALKQQGSLGLIGLMIGIYSLVKSTGSTNDKKRQ